MVLRPPVPSGTVTHGRRGWRTAYAAVMLPCAVMTVADASVWFGDSSARRRLAAAWAASADAAPFTPGRRSHRGRSPG